MFFELRQYRIKDGRMDEWVQFMESEIIPFQVSKGMVVIGSFVGEEEEDLYIWIRRFEDEVEREKLYKAVYEDPHWLEELSTRVGDIMDRERIVVTRMLPTGRSVIH
ncbi:MAG: NIPSNAP family protein [Candidatus Latescibacterota bacterium]|nr:NIPSNAP family protein [Candidatus Latescibacterota bacterium]